MPKPSGAKTSGTKASGTRAPATAAVAAAASSSEKDTGGLGLLSSMYGDDDDEAGETQAAASSSSSKMVVQSAPYVLAEAPSGHELVVLDAGKEDKKTSQTVVFHNPGYETMWADTQGPSLSAHEQRMAGIKAKNNYSGHVAAYHPVSEFAFEEQYHTFNARRQAQSGLLGSARARRLSLPRARRAALSGATLAGGSGRATRRPAIASVARGSRLPCSRCRHRLRPSEGRSFTAHCLVTE